jgi:hypothetical protein
MSDRTPDGLPDFDRIGAGSTTTSSAKRDIFGTTEEDAARVLIVRQGKRGGGFQGKYNLDPYDRPGAAQPTPNTPPAESTYGDQLRYPVEEFAKDPKGYLDLQRRLFAAGFYGSKDPASIPWGQDVAGTIDAWRKVLELSLQSAETGNPLTPEEVLRRGAAAGKAGGAPPKSLIIDYTDPEQVAGVVQRAAQASLGRNLSDEEIQHFVSEFRVAETDYAKARYKGETDTTGGTFEVSRPDLGDRANDFVEQGHETEIGGNRMADYVSALERMLG